MKKLAKLKSALLSIVWFGVSPEVVRHRPWTFLPLPPWVPPFPLPGNRFHQAGVRQVAPRQEARGAGDRHGGVPVAPGPGPLLRRLSAFDRRDRGEPRAPRESGGQGPKDAERRAKTRRLPRSALGKKGGAETWAKEFRHGEDEGKNRFGCGSKLNRRELDRRFQSLVPSRASHFGVTLFFDHRHLTHSNHPIGPRP